MRNRWIPEVDKNWREKAKRDADIHEREFAKRLNGRIYRPIFGIKTSEDFGKKWRTAAVCDECRDSVEPPTLRKDLGVAGVRSCDWCGARNETMKGE